MKEFLIAIAILLALVAVFSTIESRIELDDPSEIGLCRVTPGSMYPARKRREP